MKTKKPKKFKRGKIEIWCNFMFNSIRYVVNSKGEGKHAMMSSMDPIWHKNKIHRKLLLNRNCGDEFVGYL